MTRIINKSNICLHFQCIFNNHLFQNLLILTIFRVSFNPLYSILLLLTSKIKDVYYFYLMFKTSIFFGLLYIIIFCIHNKKLQQFFICVLGIILACILIPKHYAYAESVQILSQLQRYQLHLLKARIELEEFGSVVPHLYTIFQSPHDHM